MEHIRSFFQHQDKLAAHLGIELLDVSEGRAKAKLAIGPAHLNGVRTAHGGAIFTLADLAFAAAANSHGTVAVAINVSISYLKAALEGGVLTAEAREITRNAKLGHYTVHVTDEASEVVAIFQGIVYRKRDPLPM